MNFKYAISRYFVTFLNLDSWHSGTSRAYILTLGTSQPENEYLYFAVQDTSG